MVMPPTLTHPGVLRISNYDVEPLAARSYTLAMDLATIASLATAFGTLVLAVATFASVRSSSRSAKVTERAFLVASRPLLVPSNIVDPPEKIRFQDGRWIKIAGGHAYAEAGDQAVIFAIALRNAGQGLALLDRWRADTATTPEDFSAIPPELGNYRRLSRDIYVTASLTGFWQGAIRDPLDPQFDDLVAAIREQHVIMIDIEYADQDGGQRTISRFALSHHGDDDQEWLASVARHWRLDGHNPR